jgi:hypothetical protein
MTKKLIITVRASMPDAGTLGKLREEVQVMTKSDVYKVPVDCQILTQEEFDKQNQESFAQTGKNITNSRVKTDCAQAFLRVTKALSRPSRPNNKLPKNSMLENNSNIMPRKTKWKPSKRILNIAMS